MAETGPGPGSPDAAHDAPHDASDRGSLELRDKALQRIVEGATAQVAGVLPRGRRGGWAGETLPHARVDLEGSRARVRLDAAVAWPSDVTGIASRVRDSVLAEATRLSGVSLRSVDVTLHVVDGAAHGSDAARVR